MKKIIILVLLLLANCNSTLLANSATKEKDIEELLTIMELNKSLDSALEKQLRIEIERNPSLARYEIIMKDYLKKYMGWESLKDDYIRLYAITFTEEEIQVLLNFYKTSAGQKMVKHKSELIAEGTNLGLKRVLDHMPELEAMITAVTIEKK